MPVDVRRDYGLFSPRGLFATPVGDAEGYGLGTAGLLGAGAMGLTKYFQNRDIFSPSSYYQTASPGAPGGSRFTLSNLMGDPAANFQSRIISGPEPGPIYNRFGFSPRGNLTPNVNVKQQSGGSGGGAPTGGSGGGAPTGGSGGGGPKPSKGKQGFTENPTGILGQPTVHPESPSANWNEMVDAGVDVRKGGPSQFKIQTDPASANLTAVARTPGSNVPMTNRFGVPTWAGFKYMMGNPAVPRGYMRRLPWFVEIGRAHV